MTSFIWAANSSVLFVVVGPNIFERLELFHEKMQNAHFVALSKDTGFSGNTSRTILISKRRPQERSACCSRKDFGKKTAPTDRRRLYHCGFTRSQSRYKMDITDIQFPDSSYDFIYCSHVLEHVPNDRKAMREFYRVQSDDGFAVLIVPIYPEPTIEDPSIEDPKERLRLFGQDDHVRKYGPDFADRLKEAGFKVQAIAKTDLLSPEEIKIAGLTYWDGRIFICKQ